QNLTLKHHQVHRICPRYTGYARRGRCWSSCVMPTSRSRIMLRTWWQRVAKATRRSPRPHTSVRKSGFGRPHLEWLENRLAPATHTWTGATSALWSVDSNWTGGSPAGDASAVLVFPAAAANHATMNDLSNLTLQSITISANDYTLAGSAITLNGGGVTLDSMVFTGTVIVSLPVTLGAAQTWTVTNASSIRQVDGVVSGAAGAGLTTAGAGIVTLTGANTYTGPTTVAAGTLQVNGSQPGSNVTVASGATLGGSGTVGT